MCGVCGCGQATIEGGGHPGHGHPGHGCGHHHHDHEHDHRHHGHGHPGPGDAAGGALDFGSGEAGVSVPGIDQARLVKIERAVLSENDAYAARNRAWFTERGIFALNLVSSPGSGKTTLLVRTIGALMEQVPVAVIEGDQQTSFDAERIRATGVPALQVNTGKGCHLDGHMIAHAVATLKPAERSVLFIENVGNLVCPAGFDLGEAHKVAILSVTEGEDKPLKYPDMFAAADLVILNKTDLLPHLDFDVERCEAFIRRVNPGIGVIRLSARSGEGMDDWLAWIRRGREKILAQAEALRAR